jgi:hypothetical protein
MLRCGLGSGRMASGRTCDKHAGHSTTTNCKGVGHG